MTFEDRITLFSDRFLRERTFELVVAPALADFQFDAGMGRMRVSHYVAVMRAVAGALWHDLTVHSWAFAALALLPACYYTALLVIFSDFFATSGGGFLTLTLIAVLSLGPVAACFWPDRYTARPLD